MPPSVPACRNNLQALLAEAEAELSQLEGGLVAQPPRLQRKHASLQAYAAALRQQQQQ